MVKSLTWLMTKCGSTLVGFLLGGRPICLQARCDHQPAAQFQHQSACHRPPTGAVMTLDFWPHQFRGIFRIPHFPLVKSDRAPLKLYK